MKKIISCTVVILLLAACIFSLGMEAEQRLYYKNRYTPVSYYERYDSAIISNCIESVDEEIASLQDRRRQFVELQKKLMVKEGKMSPIQANSFVNP